MQQRARSRDAAGTRKLVKMKELVRLSGTPAATIKHYLREGLIDAAVRTSRNMALYDPEVVPRIRKIKELQSTRFLPLRVIKKLLREVKEPTDDAALAAAITRVLEREGRAEKRTHAELLDAGHPAGELAFLEERGLVSPKVVRGEKVYSGDDLALIRTLADVRRSGLAELLPLEVLTTYVDAMRALVRDELRIYRQRVLPRAGAKLPELSESAVLLSERLVLLLRRKLLLPTLEQLVAERASGTRRTKRKGSRHAR